jgi:hypothetical protein
MDAEQEVSVYALVDPRTNAIRYIGTSSDPETRFATHRQPGSRLPGVRDWVASLRKRGREPRLIILERVSLAIAAEAEARWIAHHSDGQLLNRTRGGGLGRPTKPAAERADQRVVVRLYAQDVERLARLSAGLGKTAGETMRLALAALENPRCPANHCKHVQIISRQQ